MVTLTKHAIAPVIEVMERRKSLESQPNGDMIIPNVLRINGQSMLCPDNQPVTVRTGPNETVMVTLTLIARRVVIGVELDA